MKGLLLVHYYSTNKSILSYFLTSILFSFILFYFDAPGKAIVSSLIIINFAVSPALDALKQEALSGWIKYVSTLPLKRDSLIYSHFAYYSILMLVGFCISLTILLSFSALTTSFILVISVALQLTLIYPLTYALGSEKANIIQFTVSLIIIGVFLLYSYVLLRVEVNMTSPEYIYILPYFILSIIIFVSSIVVSVKLFQAKEL